MRAGPWGDCEGMQEGGMGRSRNPLSEPKVSDACNPKQKEKEACDADESPHALLLRLATDHSLRLLDHANRLLPQAYDNAEVEAVFQAHYVRLVSEHRYIAHRMFAADRSQDLLHRDSEFMGWR